MKRVLSLIMCLALALTCATLIFAACDHEHQFDTDTWEKDATSHWHKCAQCDEKSDVADHNFVNGVCSDCGYVNTSWHKHTFATTWSKDDTYHWHAATCEHTSVVADKEEHSFNGSGKCTVCNYNKEEQVFPDRIAKSTWEAIFADLASMGNFTQTKVTTNDNGTSTVKLEVMQDAIHEQSVGDGDYDEYILFEDGKAVVYEMYNGAWIPFAQRDYDFNELLVSFYADTFELLEFLKGEYTHFIVADDGSYVNEFTGAEYRVRYEVVFADDELYSVTFTLDALGFNSTNVITLYDIGSTGFVVEPYHAHEYDDEWSCNNRFHWHESTCHDGVIDVKLQHDFGDDNTCNDCGYTGVTSSGAEVTEEQWQSAFVFNGINNWTYSYVDFGIDTVVKYTGSALESVDTNFALAMDEDGTVWNYRKNNDTWYKSESSSFADVIELRTQSAKILSGFTTLAKVYNQFSYAEGKYTATGVLMGNLGLTNATVEVIFDDGELVSITVVVELDTYTTTVRLYNIGVTMVFLEGAVEHEHNWEVRRDGSFAPDRDVHNLICWECNYSLLNQPHNFVDGECTVCGVSNHQHVYDRYKPIADGALHVCYCECGVEGEVENHTWDDDGECIYCHYVDGSQGGEDPDDGEHNWVWDGEKSDSEDHWLICTIHDDEGKWENHKFDADDVCEVCGFAHYWEYNGSRDSSGHWMECSDCYDLVKKPHVYDSNGVCEVCGYQECTEHVVTEWYYDEETHWGNCDNCDEFIEEAHDWLDEEQTECSVCDVHEHIWVYDPDFEDFEPFDEDDHMYVCSVCGKTGSWESHNTDGEGGKCSVCGYEAHEHVWIWDGERIDTVDHGVKCSICGTEGGWQDHNYNGTENCVDCGAERHYHNIDVDGFDDEIHWGDCDICWLYVEEEHNTDGEGGKCTVCGYFEHEHQVSEWEYELNYHWGTCEICKMRIEGSHEFDNGVDCSVCDYYVHVHTSTDFAYDDWTHWGDCDICGLYVDVEHNWIDEDHTECSECDVHEHVWIYEDGNGVDAWEHQLTCEICGRYGSWEEHEYDEHGDCEVCGYHKED